MALATGPEGVSQVLEMSMEMALLTSLWEQTSVQPLQDTVQAAVM